MAERVMTEQEEKIYRLRHHDFGGLSTRETAGLLKITEANVQQVLRRLEMKCPQLFPILTKRQAFIQDCIVKFGFTHQKIAESLDISEDTVNSIVSILKAKGVCFSRPRKTLRYTEQMDGLIKQKF